MNIYVSLYPKQGFDSRKGDKAVNTKQYYSKLSKRHRTL